MSKKLWKPDLERIRSTNMWEFADNAKMPLNEFDYSDLHSWSVAEPGRFWRQVWAHANGIGDLGDVDIQDDLGPAASFFPEGQLNFAENYLQRTDEEIAITYFGESAVKRSLTFSELRLSVGRAQRALLSEGVTVGDRVATVLPNGPEAIITFLAAASIGAVYSSTSPDFGANGIIDRFSQIEPKVLIVTDVYFYAGVKHDITDKILAVAESIPSIEKVIVAPYDPETESASLSSEITPWCDWVDNSNQEPEFTRLPFNHPIYILYSSGTTGKPKCIVHRAGGILLKHWSELLLHCDLSFGDRMFYFTTTGWMMWNWLIAGLSCGVSLILYDGSPFHPTPERLFDIGQETQPNLFGVSAKFIEAVMKEGLTPIHTHNFESIKVLASTGSPLAPEGFEYVYENIKKDVHLASFSGGTDICGCFVTGNPLQAVYSGEIQSSSLGLDMRVFNDDGTSATSGSRGELVCANPFPSMPLQFWQDPEDRLYRSAYFERFPDVWHHGDFAEWTESGGMIISGRSDATLNPGGIRIGTAEIYRQVDVVDEVLESVVIGQNIGADTRVVLFVRLRPDLVLDDELRQRIKQQIRIGASPRHVPSVIAQVPLIPRTRSGKLVELAVRETVHGRPVHNLEAIDQPDALLNFQDHPDVRITF